MRVRFNKRDVALAAIAALGTTTLTVGVDNATAQSATPGKYVAGDFHNHTTCSDGSLSMQKLVRKATGPSGDGWGLDWFVQAGHGGNGNRNCTLTEDAALATPAYPFTNQGPTTTWANSIGSANLKGLNAATSGNMWRWQSLQSFQYPVMEYLSANKNLPLFVGLESVVAGHEHSSMSVITGQMPASIDTVNTSASSYTPLGDANALAKWSYCFDRGDTDTSRGNPTVGTAFVAGGNNWDCSVTGSANGGDLSWNSTAQKLIPAGSGAGSGVGTKGHAKTVEAVKWMKEFHADASYYVPAHLERAGPFSADGNQGYNIEHLRDFNNAAPRVAFGFETQPGHGASNARGEYQQNRNTFPDGSVVDSVGGTTYGGTGVYGAQIGGVWDALLGEGRAFWFFASSDWHNRGVFGSDDRRTTQDFQPGEYQRNYTMVRNGADKLRPQTIVDGLRTGNNWAASGQLIDRLAFVACSGVNVTAIQVQALAVDAATNGTAVDNVAGCANMGEKLVVAPGANVVVAVVVRDPAGKNNSPYSFPNPSLLQVTANPPAINEPVLDHVDIISGKVTGFRDPANPAQYAGEWPRNANWLNPTTGATAGLGAVPAAAKNTSAALLATFGNGTWTAVTTSAGPLLAMTYTIAGATQSQYVRLRGSNIPPATPFETDAGGNPLTDMFTNAVDTSKLKIPCTAVGTPANIPAVGSRKPYTGNTIDGCPTHLPVVGGVKYVAYDVAAWSDLWFYSNPIYVEVTGSVPVAGVTSGVPAAVATAKRATTVARPAVKPSGKYTIASIQ